MKKYKVAILGATGAVGQRFVSLLQDHPYFEIAALCGSERSAGGAYKDMTHWIIGPDIPQDIKDQEVLRPDPQNMPDGISFVFSAIPSEVAHEVEGAFAKEGYKVFSNTRTYRMEEDVPLIVPEVNADHMALIEKQKARGWKGCIVTNPNCIAIPLALALKPLHDSFLVRRVIVSTMQAISGAGYPGVSALDIVDNVVPFISGEEAKVISETQKILGDIGTKAEIAISPSCHRVGSIDGHLIDAHISLGKRASSEEVKSALRNFRGRLFGMNLPSAPEPLIVVREEENRPQPKLDRMAGKGMAITIGRVREDEVLENGVKMEILGHNTIRGAAGCAILNAEYYVHNYT